MLKTWAELTRAALILCSIGILIQDMSPENIVSPNTGHLLAATPPMGWNSWDGYGTTINEAEFKANADWFAKHLKPLGWQFVTIDMEWFVTNPVPQGNSKNAQYSMDEYGRYVPPASRFPSSANNAGFK